MSDDVNVQVKASIDGLKAAMLEASASVKKFSTEAKEHIETFGGVFEKLNGIMVKFAAVLAGGAFFKEAVEATEEWTNSTKALSKQLGITTEEASSLNAALEGIDSSAQAYIDAAQKLDRQLRTNEASFGKLGVATRDANGQLLPQNILLQNAITALRGYSEGIDRNLAAMTLFGRGAGDTSKLLRLTNEEMEKGAENARKFGLIVDKEAVTAALRYNDALDDVRLAFTGMQRVIGESVMPTLAALAESFAGDGKAVEVLGIFIKTLGTAFIGLKLIVEEVVNAIGGYFAELVVRFEQYTETISNYATLNFTKASEAWKNGQAKLDAVMAETRAKVQKDAQESRDAIAKIWNIGGVNDGPKNAPASTSTGGKSFPTGLLKDSGAAEEKDAAKEADKLAALQIERGRLLNRQELQMKQDLNKQELDLDRITNAQFLKNKLAIQQQLDAIDIQAAQDKIDAIRSDVVAKEKAENEKLQVVQRAARTEADIKHQLTLEEQKDYQNLSRTINSSFQSAVSSVIDGSKSMKDAFKDFASSVISEIAKIEAKKLAASLFGGGTGSGGGGGGLGGIIGGLLGGLGSGGSGFSLSQSFGFATSAPGTYGPFPSFAVGAWDLPGDTMAQVHKGEMIIPASQASAIRNGGMGHNITMNISTPDSQSFRKNSGQMMADMQAALARSKRNN